MPIERRDFGDIELRTQGGRRIPIVQPPQEPAGLLDLQPQVASRLELRNKAWDVASEPERYPVTFVDSAGAELSPVTVKMAVICDALGENQFEEAWGRILRLIGEDPDVCNDVDTRNQVLVHYSGALRSWGTHLLRGGREEDREEACGLYRTSGQLAEMLPEGHPERCRLRSESRNGTGVVQLLNGDHAEARTTLQTSFQADPTLPGWHANFGAAEYLLGEPERALRVLDEAVSGRRFLFHLPGEGGSEERADRLCQMLREQGGDSVRLAGAIGRNAFIQAGEENNWRIIRRIGNREENVGTIEYDSDSNNIHITVGGQGGDVGVGEPRTSGGCLNFSSSVAETADDNYCSRANRAVVNSRRLEQLLREGAQDEANAAYQEAWHDFRQAYHQLGIGIPFLDASGRLDRNLVRDPARWEGEWAGVDDDNRQAFEIIRRNHIIMENKARERQGLELIPVPDAAASSIVEADGNPVMLLQESAGDEVYAERQETHAFEARLRGETRRMLEAANPRLGRALDALLALDGGAARVQELTNAAGEMIGGDVGNPRCGPGRLGTELFKRMLPAERHALIDAGLSQTQRRAQVLDYEQAGDFFMRLVSYTRETPEEAREQEHLADRHAELRAVVEATRAQSPLLALGRRGRMAQEAAGLLGSCFLASGILDDDEARRYAEAGDVEQFYERFTELLGTHSLNVNIVTARLGAPADDAFRAAVVEDYSNVVGELDRRAGAVTQASEAMAACRRVREASRTEEGFGPEDCVGFILYSDNGRDAFPLHVEWDERNRNWSVISDGMEQRDEEGNWTAVSDDMTERQFYRALTRGDRRDAEEIFGARQRQRNPHAIATFRSDNELRGFFNRLLERDVVLDLPEMDLSLETTFGELRAGDRIEFTRVGEERRALHVAGVNALEDQPGFVRITFEPEERGEASRTWTVPADMKLNELTEDEHSLTVNRLVRPGARREAPPREAGWEEEERPPAEPGERARIPSADEMEAYVARRGGNFVEYTSRGREHRVRWFEGSYYHWTEGEEGPPTLIPDDELHGFMQHLEEDARRGRVTINTDVPPIAAPAPGGALQINIPPRPPAPAPGLDSINAAAGRLPPAIPTPTPTEDPDDAYREPYLLAGGVYDALVGLRQACENTFGRINPDSILPGAPPLVGPRIDLDYSRRVMLDDGTEVGYSPYYGGERYYITPAGGERLMVVRTEAGAVSVEREGEDWSLAPVDDEATRQRCVHAAQRFVNGEGETQNYALIINFEAGGRELTYRHEDGELTVRDAAGNSLHVKRGGMSMYDENAPNTWGSTGATKRIERAPTEAHTPPDTHAPRPPPAPGERGGEAEPREGAPPRLEAYTAPEVEEAQAWADRVIGAVEDPANENVFMRRSGLLRKSRRDEALADVTSWVAHHVRDSEDVAALHDEARRYYGNLQAGNMDEELFNTYLWGAVEGVVGRERVRGLMDEFGLPPRRIGEVRDAFGTLVRRSMEGGAERIPQREGEGRVQPWLWETPVIRGADAGRFRSVFAEDIWGLGEDPADLLVPGAGGMLPELSRDTIERLHHNHSLITSAIEGRITSGELRNDVAYELPVELEGGGRLPYRMQVTVPGSGEHRGELLITYLTEDRRPLFRANPFGDPEDLRIPVTVAPGAPVSVDLSRLAGTRADADYVRELGNLADGGRTLTVPEGQDELVADASRNLVGLFGSDSEDVRAAARKVLDRINPIWGEV